MKKKNKKLIRKHIIETNSDVQDEKLALAAIFGSDFEVDETQQSIAVTCIPHTAGLEENNVSVKLLIQ